MKRRKNTGNGSQDGWHWEKYRDAIWICKDRIRKAKAQMEVNLVRDVTNNKKGFYRYNGQLRKAQKVYPLVRRDSWQQRTRKLLKYSMHSLPQKSLTDFTHLLHP